MWGLNLEHNSAQCPVLRALSVAEGSKDWCHIHTALCCVQQCNTGVTNCSGVPYRMACAMCPTISVTFHHTAVTSCKTIIFVFLSVLHTWKQFTACSCSQGPTDGLSKLLLKMSCSDSYCLLTGCRLAAKVAHFKTVHNKIFKSPQQHTRRCPPSAVLPARCFPNNSSAACSLLITFLLQLHKTQHRCQFL